MLVDSKGKPYPVKDRQAAIKNLGGMVWLYDKHLSKFRDTYENSPETVHNLLLQGHTDDARILIHSVKGLAGTLGLVQLYYAASLLERAIISSDPSLHNYLEIYRNCLHDALSS